MIPRPLGGEAASGHAQAAHVPHAAAAPKSSTTAEKPVRPTGTPGVHTSFSPQGLQLAAAGADKLASAAELATQGLGQIGAAAVDGVGAMAASTLDALGDSITAGADQLGGALRTTISTAALAAIAGAALLGGPAS